MRTKTSIPYKAQLRSKTYFTLLLLGISITLPHCSSGKFDAQTSIESSNNKSAQELPGNNDTQDPQNRERRKELAATIESSNFDGYVSQGFSSSNTVPVLSFDKVKGEFKIRIPMPLFANLVAFEMIVKKYPDIKLVGEKINSLSYVAIIFPTKYLLHNVTEAQVTLPNGEIPYFPSGEQISSAFLLTPDASEKIYLYLNAEAIGVFVETKFDPTNLGDISLTKLIYSVTNKEKTAVMGYLSLISAKNNNKGGFFMSYRLDPKLSRILEEYYLY
ncbi:MAG: hypothetical protein L6Q37_05575 [Bdellovibrionaceae bacterium]|nr:hypothetical protein [Pseudobdellovibrionaceae bacterium]NUM57023.1 hypothetical protein [Pseudobdellovibrionaceae bacterium]